MIVVGVVLIVFGAMGFGYAFATVLKGDPVIDEPTKPEGSHGYRYGESETLAREQDRQFSEGWGVGLVCGFVLGASLVAVLAWLIRR